MSVIRLVKGAVSRLLAETLAAFFLKTRTSDATRHRDTELSRRSRTGRRRISPPSSTETALVRGHFLAGLGGSRQLDERRLADLRGDRQMIAYLDTSLA
jgi:hypothetical protein